MHISEWFFATSFALHAKYFVHTLGTQDGKKMTAPIQKPISKIEAEELWDAWATLRDLALRLKHDSLYDHLVEVNYDLEHIPGMYDTR